VVAPGLLAATSVPNSGRLSVGGKSPLTGTIKEANAGGTVAQKLARLGLAAVVVRGTSPEPVCLVVTRGGVAFRDAASLWGLGNYAAVGLLKAEHPEAGFVTIGPAGEKGLKASAVCVTTPDHLLRTAARGGLGAVLGTKGVKALVVDDAGGPGTEMREADRFKAAARALTEGISAHPLVGGFQALGTSLLVGLIDALGGLPTRNFSAGRFEGAARIGGEALAGILAGRKGASSKHHCMAGCIVWCSQVYTDTAGEFVTSGLEYETLGMVGSNCAIDDPDVIARIDRLCDDLGLDTMEVGAAAAVAMEAGRLPWGDGRALAAALDSLRRDDPFGRLLASGCVETGRAFGVARVPAVKGQALAAYDPRVLKGTGATYATCPMGADHTAGCALPSPGYDPGSPSGQGRMSEVLQTWFAAVDTLGLCLFASIPLLENPDLQARLVDAVGAKLGRALPPDHLTALGRRVCLLEKGFNRLAGFGPEADRLPAFFSAEPLPPHGGVWDVSDADLDAVLA
jgi:aldehyde:ferredoxin oxidoreductase